MARFQLQSAERTVDLPLGEFVVGRGSDCDLVLADDLVSRRHALFRVDGDRLLVEDLRSRNGIEVNGTAPDGPVELLAGDVVVIGRARLTVAVTRGPAPRPPPARAWARTLPGTSTEGAEPTALGLRGQLIEKVFAVSGPDEAEGVVRTFLNAAIADAQRSSLAAEVVDELTRFCVRLASLTGKPSWIDAVFELHLAARRVLAATVVDELHPLVRKHRYAPSPVLREYVEWLQAEPSRFSPAERFAIQRVEGLVRVSGS